MHRLRKISPFAWLLIFAALLNLGMLAMFGPNYNGDTESYLEAWRDYISQGVIDNFRTPAYPILSGICIGIAGELWDYLICFLQIALYLASMVVLRRMLCSYVKAHWIIWTMLIAYVVMPQMSQFNINLSTESFAVSVSVFAMQAVVKLFKTPGWYTSLMLSAMLILLLALRPSFIAAPAAIMLFSLIGLFVRTWRRRSVWLLGSLILPVAAHLLYCTEMERRYGIYQASVVTVFNDYQILRQMQPDSAPYFESTPKTSEIVNYGNMLEKEDPHSSIRVFWRELRLIERAVGFTELVGQLHDAFSQNHLRVKWFFKALKGSLTSKINYFCWIYYAIMLLFSALTALTLIRRRRIAWYDLLMMIYVWGNFVGVLAFAQSDWARLFAPIIPMTMLMAARVLSSVRLSPLGLQLEPDNEPQNNTKNG